MLLSYEVIDCSFAVYHSSMNNLQFVGVVAFLFVLERFRIITWNQVKAAHRRCISAAMSQEEILATRVGYGNKLTIIWLE